MTKRALVKAYPKLSEVATARKREASRVKLLKWRHDNPEKWKAQYLAYQRKNRIKIQATAKRWREENPELARAQRVRRHLRATFGISIHQFETMWEKQGRVCAICKRPRREDERRFDIDHDHQTNTIRGILCPNCNSGIGQFKDSIELMELAITYIKGKTYGQ